MSKTDARAAWARSPWFWGILWAVLVAAALALRPLLPVDETRYVGVAWEMWSRGEYLVPHLNGAPYSHKPPLLFWLINAGWGVFGVNEWWPRLVAPLFGLASLYLTSRLAGRLWPEGPVRWLAPLILLGSFYWSLFTTMTMFDMLLCFWTLAGLNGLVDFADTGRWRGGVIFGIAIGLGILSKGPVILVYLLPAAFLAPLWQTGERAVSWPRWYAVSSAGVVLGAAIALAWAVPAGFAGGATYQAAILWGQSAGRLVQSFAHQQPVWWYLPILPAIALPWIVWPTLLGGIWRAAGRRPGGVSLRRDRGLRLAAIWALAALIVLSLISGKRPHYLIPILPALALAAAAILGSGGYVRGRLDMAPLAALTLILAAAILILPLVAGPLGYPDWIAGLRPGWSVPLFVAGIWVIWRPPAAGIARVAATSAIGAIFVISLQGALAPRLAEAYDVTRLARYLATVQNNGQAVANYGKYHGQYGFLGRLTAPLTETGDGEIMSWLRDNPDGRVVSYRNKLPPDAKPEFAQRFRSGWIVVWDGAAVLKRPAIAKRD